MSQLNITPEREKQIEFIIERELGLPGSDFFDNWTSDQFPDEDLEDFTSHRNARWKQLADMAEPEFAAVYDRQRQILDQDWSKIAKPLTKDLAARWMNADAWQPSEAVALSFGMIPRANDHLWRWSERNQRVHTGAREIVDRFWYVSRAIESGVFGKNIAPQTFLEWLSVKQFAIPAHLEPFRAKITASVEELQTELSKLDQNISALKSEIEALRKELAEKPYTGKTLYLLIAVMAVGAYRDKILKRSPVPRYLSSRMNLCGHPTVPRTVKNILNKAIDHLPSQMRIAIPDEAGTETTASGTDVR